MQELQPKFQRFGIAAEALVAKKVGDARAGQLVANGPRDFFRSRRDIANEDREAIPPQMAGSQFVPMAVDFEDANSFLYEGFDQRLAAGRDRDHLAGYCLPVFHARCANILMRNLQAAGQVADKLFGRQSLLLDPKKQEFAAFVGGICRNFLNKEIFRMNFAQSPQPLKIPCNPGKRRADKVI